MEAFCAILLGYGSGIVLEDNILKLFIYLTSPGEEDHAYIITS